MTLPAFRSRDIPRYGQRGGKFTWKPTSQSDFGGDHPLSRCVKHAFLDRMFISSNCTRSSPVIDLCSLSGGGAYPEIHMSQFPLNMGNDKVKKGRVKSRVPGSTELAVAEAGDSSDVGGATLNTDDSQKADILAHRAAGKGGHERKEQFIHYRPANAHSGGNSGAETRYAQISRIECV